MIGTSEETQTKNINPTKEKTSFFKSQKNTKRLGNIFTYALLILVSLILMLPLVWMVSTSLKPMTEIAQFPPTLFPEDIQWENYLETIRSFPFFRYTGNTLFITFFVVLGNVLSNSFIAYGFAKIDFPGKKFLFSLVLSTMMIPGFVTMIPQYVLFS